MLNKIIPKYILPWLALAIILNILRIVLFGKLSFIYILWNIFLALIPFVISIILLNYSEKNKLNKTFFVIGGIVWIIFLPNAPYIVTDLIHLGVVRGVPVLYDSILLFTSAFVGVFLGLSSIYNIEKILLSKYSREITQVIIIVILGLTSFGMYIGRSFRFNSWDVFVSPLSFTSKLFDIFSVTSNHIETFSYMVLFFAFLYISYLSWKYLNKI